MPTKEDAVEAYNTLQEELSENSNFGKYLIELQNAWRPIAIMAGMTILISILYIFLLKWITKPLLYVSMLIILLCFLILGAFCF